MSEPEALDAVVIGAGPAGLMAAQMLLNAGRRVELFEAKPSVGRKLLMAGKSGLNLTKDQPADAFLAAFAEAAPHLAPMIGEFGPQQVIAWAEALGQPVFTGSSGRVFPVAMKASPLLRAWLGDLRAQGLALRLRWQWQGWERGALRFASPQGERSVRPAVTVLALGGASWARLGSDGRWAGPLAEAGVGMAPFQPANMGFNVAWSAHMAPHFGAPLKAVALIAAEHSLRAEAMISRHGLEGGGIYALSRKLREGHDLRIDLFPDRTAEELVQRLQQRPLKESLTNRLRKGLGLSGARLALALELMRPRSAPPAGMAAALKALSVPIQGPRPLDEAISVAGGIRWDALDERLMIRALPGVFVAGEMIDWEAPTGGYLLTACLATGRWAGRAAAQYSAGDRQS